MPFAKLECDWHRMSVAGGSNRTPHPDAREPACLFSVPAARAGERKQIAARRLGPR